MTHKNNEHPTNKTCRYFKDGKCHFSASECWYKHDKIPEGERIKVNENMDFQAATKNLPPDMRMLIDQTIDFLKNNELKLKLSENIKRHIEQRKTKCCKIINSQQTNKTSKIVKEKIKQSLLLPKIMNLNPRSIYNKLDEFVTFVEEEDIDLIFMSESHERAYPTKTGKNQTLKDIIDIEDFVVINNPHQREGKCGRPALVINSKKFKVEDLTNKAISIPNGVEIVWALITPKDATRLSKIK